MGRSNIAGASGDVSFTDIATLGSRWVAQRKMDGHYIRLTLDSHGCIAVGHSSTKRIVALGDLVGVHAGAPHAVVVGELEAATDESLSAIAQRGYRVVHLYDCLHDGIRSLARTPYHERRDALLRMHVAIERLGVDEDRRHHSVHQRRNGGRLGTMKRIPAPRSWRRVPVVPQVALGEASALWEQAMGGLAEGLVLVNLDAPVNGRRAKLKCKPWASVDCEVISQDSAMMTLRWSGGAFHVGNSKTHGLTPGHWCEVRYDGFDKMGHPRHPKILRRRPDLEDGIWRHIELD